MDTVRRSVLACQRERDEKKNRQDTEGFEESKAVLDGTVMVGTCHYRFAKTIKCATPRM